jgi:hypothetical protein
MSSAGVAAISAAAALLSSALTGGISYLVTRKTFQHDGEQLATQLASERDVAREDRDQGRRKEAYVSLLQYMFWLSDVNAIGQRVVDRQHDAIADLRPGGRLPSTEEEAASERAAFLAAGPTPGERKRIAAGPTSRDNAATWALVNGLSSDAVLNAFEALMDCDRELSMAQRGLQISLLRDPEASAGAEASEIDEAAERARRQILAAAKTYEAVGSVIEAHKNFEAAFEKVKPLVRSELDQARPSARRPAEGT